MQTNERLGHSTTIQQVSVSYRKSGNDPPERKSMPRKNSGMSVRCDASLYRARGRSRATYSPSTQIRYGRNSRRTGARTQFFASGHGRACTRNRRRRQRTRRSRGLLLTGVDETVGTGDAVGEIGTTALFVSRSGIVFRVRECSLHCSLLERRAWRLSARRDSFSADEATQQRVCSYLIENGANTISSLFRQKEGHGNEC